MFTEIAKITPTYHVKIQRISQTQELWPMLNQAWQPSSQVKIFTLNFRTKLLVESFLNSQPNHSERFKFLKNVFMLQQIAVQRLRLMSQTTLPTNNQLILQYLALQNQSNIPKPESSPNFSNLSSSTDDSGFLRKRQRSDESSTISENQALPSQPKKLKIEKSELFSCDVCNALFLEKVSWV